MPEDNPEREESLLSFQWRMGKLDALIAAQREAVTAAFPAIIRIHGTQSGKIYVEADTAQTEELRGALRGYFPGKDILVDQTDAKPCEVPLRRMLENGINALDSLYCGYGLRVTSDEQGGYFDMALGEDTPVNRAVVEKAFPGTRIVFTQKPPLTLRIAPPD